MHRALKALATLALVALANPSRAGVCGGRGLLVQFPGDIKQIPRNAHLLVEADPDFAALLEPASTTIAFTSAGASIPAKVVKDLLGGYTGRSRQLLIAPLTELSPNTSYHLTFRAASGVVDADRQKLLAEINLSSERWYGFSTLEQQDDTVVSWRHAPTAGGYFYSIDHGGIFENTVEVHLPLGKRTLGYVLVHAENKTRPDRAYDAIFPVSTESSRVGQISCSSIFIPLRRSLYSVRVTAISFSGKETPAPGKALALWFENG